MKKAYKFILVFLAIALLVAVGVFYIIKPGETQWTLENIMNFLNQPLPIIGVTTLAILVFVWRVIVSTNYGKKHLAKLKAANDELRQENEKFKEEAQSQINEFKSSIAGICELSTNQKIKTYGREVFGNGEEATNN